MPKKDTQWDAGAIIQLVLLLIICPVVALIDLTTKFSFIREHPIMGLICYGVTIFETFIICSIVITNYKEDKEKEKKEKEIEKNFDITDNEHLKDIFEFFRTEDGFSIETYIGFNDPEIIIPKTFHGLPITKLADGLFKECKELKKIEIYADIKEIPEHFAESCINLETIIMPNSIRYIGNYGFSWCFNLKNLMCGKNIYSIGDRAFSHTNICNLFLFPNIIDIGEGAFYSCREFSSIKIPAGIDKIPKECFANCSNLQEIVFPNKLTSIGDKSFLNCEKLENILIPNSVISIGENVFSIEKTYRPDKRYNPRTFCCSNRKLTIYCYPGSYTQQRFRGEYYMEHADMYKKE